MSANVDVECRQGSLQMSMKMSKIYRFITGKKHKKTRISHVTTRERLTFAISATMMSDDIPSEATTPLHCASILKPAMAFQSHTISAPICLIRLPKWFLFSLVESQKPEF